MLYFIFKKNKMEISSNISVLYDILKKISEKNNKQNIDLQKFIIEVNQLETPHTSILFQLMIYDNYINNRIDFENITSKCIYDFINNEGSKGVKLNIDNIPKYMQLMIELYIEIIKSK